MRRPITATPTAAPVKPAPDPVYPGPPDEPRFVYERTIRSSADVVADEQGSELRRFVTGERVTGEALNKPYAVAVWRGVDAERAGLKSVSADWIAPSTAWATSGLDRWFRNMATPL